MTAQPTPHAEPADGRFTASEFFQAIERNRGRLYAVEYACYGLERIKGDNPSCLVWILDDVMNDLDRIAATYAAISSYPEEE